MKVKTIILILIAVLLSALLSGCSSAAMRSNSWSGLTTSEDKAYLANGSFVYAINLNNGSQSWQYPAEKADTKESYFAAPILTEDGQLLVASAGANHSLASLNPANGNVNWIFDAAEGGWIASPLAIGETIYASNTDGKLYAFDMKGDFLWAKAIGGALWSQPVSDGEYLYITSLDHHLYALDPQKKEVVWNIELCGASPGAAALDADGNLYIGSFGSTVAAIDSQSQKFLWKTSIAGWVWDAPVLDETTLYVGDLEGYFHAFNIADGSEIWDPIQPDGPITGSPLVMDDFIVIGTESGTAYAIDREGSIVWQQNIGGRLYTAPAQGGDRILFSPMEMENKAVLVALDFDGKQVWQFTPAK